MAEKGGTEKDFKLKYGKMVLKNFTKIPADEKWFLISWGICGGFGIFAGLLPIILLLIFPNKIFDSEFYIIVVPLGLLFVLCGILPIKFWVTNYHEYILFENGILKSGYWREPDHFFNFRQMKKVIFSQSNEKSGDGEDVTFTFEFDDYLIKAYWFKDINKFRQKIKPLLEKYQIIIIEN